MGAHARRVVRGSYMPVHLRAEVAKVVAVDEATDDRVAVASKLRLGDRIRDLGGGVRCSRHAATITSGRRATADEPILALDPTPKAGRNHRRYFGGRMAPPRYDLPNEAPPPLRLVQRFVNTSNHETGRELLRTPAELAARFSNEGLEVPAATRSDLRRARSLREEVRRIAGTRAVTDALDDAARRAKLTIAFAATPRLEPQAGGVDGALGVVAAVAYDAMRDGSWERLKTCRNCGWAFWDKSKNRSAAWCSMELCGSRIKVRRYRARARG